MTELDFGVVIVWQKILDRVSIKCPGWQSRAGVGSYVAQSATSAEGPRTPHPPFTSTRMTVKGFTPGTVCYIRVAAVGAAGMSGYGGRVMIMAV